MCKRQTEERDTKRERDRDRLRQTVRERESCV
jgi:hypothetical protein